MDRIINIEQDNRKANDEVKEFMKELDSALNSNKLADSKNEYTTIYDWYDILGF